MCEIYNIEETSKPQLQFSSNLAAFSPGPNFEEGLKKNLTKAQFIY